jgi:protein disulfide-isomerase-like protein
LTCLFLLVALSALGLPARTSAAAPAVELDDGNFDEHVLKRRKEMWLVMFYAPWCGHCKHLKPIFDEAASKVRTYGMRMGKMDATASEVVAARYEVKGYPTLLYFRNNEPHKYKAGRSAEGFVEFARVMKQPAVKMVAARHALDKLVKDKPVVYFLAQPGVEKPEKTELFRAFQRAALAKQDQFKFLGFAANAGPEDQVLEEPRGKSKTTRLQDGDAPFIVRMERREELRYFPVERLEALTAEDEETGEPLRDSSDLEDWFERHRHRVFTALDRFNFYITSHPTGAKALLVGIVHPDDHSTAAAMKKNLHSLARVAADKHDGESPTHYGWLDGKEYKEFIEQYGLNERMLPQVIAFDAKEEKYYWEEDTDTSSLSGLRGFVERLEAGEIFPMRQGAWWYVDVVHFMILSFWPYSLLVVVAYIGLCGWGMVMCKRCMCDDDEMDEEEANYMKTMRELQEMRQDAIRKKQAKEGAENKTD